MPRPPQLLTLGVREAINALQKEELKLSLRLRRAHDARFRSMREQIRRWFLDFFVFKFPEPDRRVMVWDPGRAIRADLLARVTAGVVAVADEDLAADEQLFTDSLDAAFLEGRNRELWLLAMGGLAVGDFAEPPDYTVRTGLLLAAGVAGLSWAERLRRWRDWRVERQTRLMTAAVVSGQTLEETEDLVRMSQRQYDSHVTRLLGNELHRASGLGAQTALAAARATDEIDEVWVTKEDRLVCPICAALHLTVTDLQPITDSHPACRCWKVPVPAGYRPTALSYTEFLRDLESL